MARRTTIRNGSPLKEEHARIARSSLAPLLRPFQGPGSAGKRAIALAASAWLGASVGGLGHGFLGGGLGAAEDASSPLWMVALVLLWSLGLVLLVAALVREKTPPAPANEEWSESDEADDEDDDEHDGRRWLH